MKPRVFIASSTEGLSAAYASQENLEHDFEVTVWPQGAFDLTYSALESLCKVVRKMDGAIFVFTADDLVAHRGKQVTKVRDNVIFELGLFIGRIGRDKCFVFQPKSARDASLPSDLSGITPAVYDDDRADANLQAALGPACNRVRKALGLQMPVDSKKSPAKENLSDILMARRWRMFFFPKKNRSKVIVFGKDGYLTEGNNQNEHRWSVKNGKLVIFNLEGRIFSRFVYDPTNKRLSHTGELDTLSPNKDHYIVPEL
jgi:hypothetical protein